MKQIISTTILILVFSISAFAQNDTSLCPTIDVSGGGYVRPGEAVSFAVNIEDDTNISNLEYEWTVSAGTITSGSGTPTITVDTTGLRDTSLTATVKIKGLPEGCENTASENASGDLTGDPRLLDEFGKVAGGEVKARMDAVYVKLGDEPNSQGYIINYGTDKEIAAREKQIQRAIAFRKFDASRVTIVRGGANMNGTGILTKIYIVPPGANNPEP